MHNNQLRRSCPTVRHSPEIMFLLMIKCKRTSSLRSHLIGAGVVNRRLSPVHEIPHFRSRKKNKKPLPHSSRSFLRVELFFFAAVNRVSSCKLAGASRRLSCETAKALLNKAGVKHAATRRGRLRGLLSCCGKMGLTVFWTDSSLTFPPL